MSAISYATITNPCASSTLVSVPEQMEAFGCCFLSLAIVSLPLSSAPPAGSTRGVNSHGLTDHGTTLPRVLTAAARPRTPPPVNFCSCSLLSLHPLRCCCCCCCNRLSKRQYETNHYYCGHHQHCRRSGGCRRSDAGAANVRFGFVLPLPSLLRTREEAQRRHQPPLKKKQEKKHYAVVSLPKSQKEEEMEECWLLPFEWSTLGSAIW